MSRFLIKKEIIYQLIIVFVIASFIFLVSPLFLSTVKAQTTCHCTLPACGYGTCGACWGIDDYGNECVLISENWAQHSCFSNEAVHVMCISAICSEWSDSCTECCILNEYPLGSYCGTPKECGSGPVTPDFSPLDIVQLSRTINQGQSTAYDITLTPSYSYSGTVNLSVSGCPSGASCTLSPTSITFTNDTPNPGISAMTVTNTAGVTPGTYTLTVTGTDGTLTHSDTADLIVQVPTPPCAIVPASVPAGQSFNASVKMFNNTGITWNSVAINPTNPHRLGSQSPTDNSRWGFGRVELPVNSVPPGQNVTFNFTPTAPSNPAGDSYCSNLGGGSYSCPFNWAMLQEGIAWYYGTLCAASITVTPAPPTCASSAPQSPSTTATSGTFYAYAYGVTNATSVNFPTWGDPGGQDDIVWYPGTNMGGGTWRAAIDLGNHKSIPNGGPEFGNFNVHIYMYNGSYINQWCGTANFSRNIVCPSSPTSYPSNSWDRVWCDKGFVSKLADTPDESAEQFNTDWGAGVVGGIRADDIGFRSGRTINFPYTGIYTFNLGSDDGIRVWIDGGLVLDKWYDRGYIVDTFTRSLTAGNHQVRIDYYENGGGATVSLGYSKLSQCSDGIDNDSDGKIDSADPSCHSDNDPNNPGSYIPSRDDESFVPQPDFTFNSSNAIYATLTGGPSQTSNSTTITIISSNGFNDNINLSVQSTSPNLAGATYNFSNPTLTSLKYSSGSTFSINIPGNTPAGTYAITIKGVDGGLIRTVNVNLNVEVFNPGWQEI